MQTRRSRWNPSASNSTRLSNQMEHNIQSLITTADALVKKLREVGDDPRFTAVFQFWQNHGMVYNGPFYVDELDSLERALKSFTYEPTAGSDNDRSAASDERSV